MKKNSVLIIIFAVVVAVGMVMYWMKCSKTAPPGDMLTANLAAISQSEVPDYKLSGSDSILRFDARVADLGRVKMGQKKNAVFEFANVGSTPAVIIKIITTCGCTSAAWEKAPLMPGKRSQINVTFEAQEKGVFFKKLYIYYAGSTTPLEIAIKGEVK